MRYLPAVAATLFGLLMPLPAARADFSMAVIEEPQGGGSWSIGLGLLSSAPIDLVGTRITYGEHYGERAFLDFTREGWSEYFNDPDQKMAAAWGTFYEDLGFTLHFSGDFADPVHMDVVAFSGETLLGCMHGYWPGDSASCCAFQIGPADWDPDRDVFQVPSPAAAPLGVAGLVFVGLARRRL
jgi:hypothetical protein